MTEAEKALERLRTMAQRYDVALYGVNGVWRCVVTPRGDATFARMGTRDWDGQSPEVVVSRAWAVTYGEQMVPKIPDYVMEER